MVSQFKLFDDVTIPPKKDKRHRFQFRFHLDVNRQDQLELGKELESLKRQRRYTPTILDALRLILDLREGGTAMLKTLFPNVVQSLHREAVNQIEPPQNNQVVELMAQIVDIQKQLAARPAAPALPAPSAGPKPLNIPKYDTPSFEDDDLDTIQLKRDTSTDSAGNFLNSLSALAGNAFVEAAPDDGKQARASFAGGLGNLFADDDDDDF